MNVFFRQMLKNPGSLKKNLVKTQGPREKTQEPKIRSKNPRSWAKTQGVATLQVITITVVTQPIYTDNAVL